MNIKVIVKIFKSYRYIKSIGTINNFSSFIDRNFINSPRFIINLSAAIY